MSQPNDELVMTRGMLASWIGAAFLGGLVAIGVSRLWSLPAVPGVIEASRGTNGVPSALTPSGSAEFAEFLPPLSPIEQRIEAVLDQSAEFDFSDTPLTDVVTYFGKLVGIPIRLDVDALNDEAIPLDSPITRQIKGVRLRSALHWILDPIKLEFIVDADLLKVTTHTKAAEKLITRTYPVSDLCRMVSDKGVYDVQSLITLIEEETSGPWQSNGSESGTITDFATTGSVTIRQSYQVHREIVELLQNLRRAQRQDLALADPTALKRWDDQRSAAASAVLPKPTPTEFVEVIGTMATDTERLIEQALDKPVSVNFQDLPLTEVVKFVSNHLGVNVLLDRKAFNEEGIPLDTPVNMQVEKIKTRSMLTLVLYSINLEAVIDHEVLLITTTSKGSQLLISRTYPVSDLIGPNGDFQSLIQMLEGSTRGPWQNRDGDGGSISQLPTTGSLIVRQTRAVHDQVLRLLQQQRMAQRQNPKGLPRPDSRRFPNTTAPH